MRTKKEKGKGYEMKKKGSQSTNKTCGAKSQKVNRSRLVGSAVNVFLLKECQSRMLFIGQCSGVSLSGGKASLPKEASWIVSDILRSLNISEFLSIYTPRAPT